MNEKFAACVTPDILVDPDWLSANFETPGIRIVESAGMKAVLKLAGALGLGLMLGACVISPTVKTPPLSGVVLDAASKLPVAGASVSVATLAGERTASSVTALDGYFMLPAVREWQAHVLMGGDHLYTAVISVQHPGYAPGQAQASSFHRPDRVPFQTIRLKKIH